ncbi:MAG: hypothetical protein ACYTX0_50050 [Nostoc sp.]
MSRLIVSLPGIIGTSGSDLVVGKEDNVFPAIGIEVLKKGVIDTQAGNDTIKGSATGGDDSRGDQWRPGKRLHLWHRHRRCRVLL